MLMTLTENPAPPTHGPTSARFANFMTLALPASMLGVLTWAFMSPEDDYGNAATPHQVSGG